MRSSRLLILILPLLGACAEGQLAPGVYKNGIAVEVPAATEADGQKQAVAGLIDLFVAPAVREGQARVIDERILARAGEFVPRSKPAPGSKIRALVSCERLGHELDALGLVRPDGVAGAPRLFLSFDGSDSDEAAQSLRRSLMERGYIVVEERQAKIESGVAVSGSARVFAADDPRLAAYRPVRAEVRLKATGVPDGQALGEFTQEATAVDAGSEPAKSKALANAGLLAASRLREALAGRYRERTEMTVLFAGFGSLDRARRLLSALRSDPQIAAAALDSISGGDLKLRVFVEKPSADELAARLTRLKGYSLSVRSVEPDYHYVELENAGAF